MSSSLWEIMNKNDVKPTYMLQWEYKNTFYEMYGKIEQQQIEKIAENVLF